MKGYNNLKNILIAIASAILFYNHILEGGTVAGRIFAILVVMVAIYILLGDADDAHFHYLKKLKIQKKEALSKSDEGDAKENESKK